MSKTSTSKTRSSPTPRADWKRVDSTRDENIDFSDIPEVTPEQFAKAIARRGLKPVARKTQITLRIDEDVVIWFKQHGPGYQTQINELLREYMKACKSGK